MYKDWIFFFFQKLYLKLRGNASGLTGLVSLNMSNSGVTNEGLQYLKPLKNLRSLSLEYCKVDAVEIKKLQLKALPNLVRFRPDSWQSPNCCSCLLAHTLHLVMWIICGHCLRRRRALITSCVKVCFAVNKQFADTVMVVVNVFCLIKVI